MANDNRQDQEMLKEFLAYKRQKEDAKRKRDRSEEVVTVRDEKGRSACVPAWRAKEFLDSLGIDTSDLEKPAKEGTEETEFDEDEHEESDEVFRRSTGRQSRGRSRRDEDEE